MKWLWIVLLVSAYASTAHADSIPYVTQNNGQTLVSLAGNPTVGPSYDLAYCVQHLGGPYVEFGNLPQGPVSLTVDGMTETAPDGFPVQGFNVPRDLYHPTTATLDLNGQDYTFQIVDPVPETSTWILMGTGLLALWKQRSYCLR